MVLSSMFCCGLHFMLSLPHPRTFPVRPMQYILHFSSCTLLVRSLIVLCIIFGFFALRVVLLNNSLSCSAVKCVVVVDISDTAVDVIDIMHRPET